jgi:HAE1 family hydrophobic/amphiphilic exporter-1
MSSVGSGGSNTGTNTGRIFMNLKPRSERGDAVAVMRELQHKLDALPGIKVHLQIPPMIRIGGQLTKSQYQYTLQDLDLGELQETSERLKNALAQQPELADVATDLQLSSPAINVTIDRDRAAALGVTPAAIQTALGAAYAGAQISQIYGSSDTYEVILELLPKYQADPSALSRLYVTASDGSTLVPLTSVTRTVQSSMPLSVNHLGQLPSVTLSFNLAPGYALSDAQRAIQRAQDEIGMPSTLQASFQGAAQAFQSSTGGIGWLLLAGLIVVYIVLGILYESFIHPLTILSGLPSAAVGALITLKVFAIPLTLFAFVGMMMLIGIVKKNAIMMIDFALGRQRAERVGAETAILEAAAIRFRPIMMTTMAALMGTLPIAIGFGSGSETRRPLGLAVVGGLLLSQLLTLYITPVLFVYLDRIAQRLSFRMPLRQPAE